MSSLTTYATFRKARAMTDGTTYADPSDPPAISITRIFDAPRELVYAAWTDPRQFAVWFGGPDGEIPLDTVSMDARPGGKWKLTMFYGPDRTAMPWHGEFIVLDPPARIVMTLSDTTDSDDVEPLIIRFNEADGGRTEMVFEQRGGHLDAAGYEQARQGWLVFFDTLAGLLAA